MDMILAALDLLTRMLPFLRFYEFFGGPEVTAMVKLLTEVVPIATRESNDLNAPISAIIAALSAHPATTKAQLASLRALEANVDAGFNAAAKADRIA